MKEAKFLIYLIMSFILLLGVYPATVNHPAEQVSPGTFNTGSYIFPGGSRVGINLPSAQTPQSELDINGQLIIDSNMPNKIVLSGNQVEQSTPVSHTILLRNSRGLRLWDEANQRTFEISNNGNLYAKGNAKIDGTLFELNGNIVLSGSVDGVDLSSKAPSWDTAYSERKQWDGSSLGLDATLGRNSLQLRSLAVEDQVSGGTGGNIRDRSITREDIERNIMGVKQDSRKNL